MSVGLSILLGAAVLISYSVGVPLRSTGSGLMRSKVGKPMAMPMLQVPVAMEPSFTEPARIDIRDLARRYIDELLTQEIKLQMDKTNLEKFVTEMLMWRKRAFPTPTYPSPNV